MEDYKKLLKGEIKAAPKGYWNSDKNCINAIRFYIKEFLRIEEKDFRVYMLKGSPLNGMVSTLYSQVRMHNLMKKHFPHAAKTMNKGDSIDYSKKSIRKKEFEGVLDSLLPGEKLTAVLLIKKGHRKLLEWYEGNFPKLVEDCARHRILEVRFLPRELTEDLRIQIAKKYIESKGRIPTHLEFHSDGVDFLINGMKKSELIMKAVGDGKEPWELGEVPKDFWRDDENIKYAALWLEKKLGRTPSSSDYIKNGLTSLVRLDKEKRKAILHLESHEDRLQRTNKELVEYIREFAKKHDRPPHTHDMAELSIDLLRMWKNKGQIISREVLGDRFRPWEYERTPNGYWNEETVEEAFRWLIDKVGRYPTTKDIRENGLHGANNQPCSKRVREKLKKEFKK